MQYDDDADSSRIYVDAAAVHRGYGPIQTDGRSNFGDAGS